MVKKLLFLMIIMCAGFTAHATTDIQPNGNLAGGETAANCTQPVLGTYSGSTNFEAKWRANSVPLRWYNGGNRITTVQDAAKTCNYDGVLNIPSTAPNRTGYTFAGWKVVPSVPAGYTELEYIGTNHNAYIISDLKVNDFDRVTATITLYDNDTESTTGTYPHLFGSSAHTNNGADNSKVFRFYDWSTHTMLAAYNTTWSSYWPVPTTGKTTPLNVSTDFDIKLANGHQYIKMNGEIMASNNLSATLNNPYNVTIFALNYAGGIKYTPHLDSKTITFYLGDTVVRKFVPAKRNSDNVVGMFDTITQTFFTNAGFGSFTAGPALD